MSVDETARTYSVEQEELLAAIQGLEDRVAAFAATQELQLEDLRQLVEHLRLEQRQAEAEIALYGEQATSCANEALARADEALQRLAASAAGSESRPVVAGTSASEPQAAQPDTVTARLEAIEERLALFVGQQEARLEDVRELLQHTVLKVEHRVAGAVTGQDRRLEELQQRLDVLQREQQQAEADATARAEQAASRAHAALDRAEEALRRVDQLSVAPPIRESTAEEAAIRSAPWEAVVQSVRDVEQRVALLAARREADVVELRELVAQGRGEQGPAVERIHAASQQATGRADEALRRAAAAWDRIETVADTWRAREADTMDLLGRISRGWEGLSHSVRDVEQRVAQVAARQESGLEELRQYVDHAHREQRQLVDHVSAQGEQVASRATDALLRADEALARMGIVAATLQAREVATAETLGRLSTGWDTLNSTVRDVEQRLAVRQQAGLEELRQLVDQVQHEQRQTAGEAALWGEQATVRANEAVARADATLRRLEAVTTASQTHEASITELLGRLSSGWDGVTSAIRAVERRMAAVEAEMEPLKGAGAERQSWRSGVERQTFSEAVAFPERRALGIGALAHRLRVPLSWLALTAPGALLALGLLALMLVAAPWMSGLVHVAARVRFVAGVLLLAHGVAAIVALTRGERAPTAAAVVAVLVADAFGAGVLFGADLRMNTPGVPICLAVLAMSLMAGGSAAGAASVLAVGAGIGVAQAFGLAPLMVAPAVWFPTTLSVETSFANVPALAPAPPVFATMLSVETMYAGRFVSSIGSSVPLFLPAMAVVSVAMCIGVAVNLLWVRKARGAGGAKLDSVHRSVVRA